MFPCPPCCADRWLGSQLGVQTLHASNQHFTGPTPLLAQMSSMLVFRSQGYQLPEQHWLYSDLHVQHRMLQVPGLGWHFLCGTDCDATNTRVNHTKLLVGSQGPVSAFIPVQGTFAMCGSPIALTISGSYAVQL